MKIRWRTRGAIYGLYFLFLIGVVLALQYFGPLPDLITSTIVTLMLGIGGILIRPLRQSLEESVQDVGAPKEDQCRILLCGLPRSGKTTLITNLLAKSERSAMASTEVLDIYEDEIRISLKPAKYVPVSVADYKGQKPSQIFIDLQEKTFLGEEGNRNISALVFFVDLFPELKDEDGKTLEDESLISLYESEGLELLRKRAAQNMEYITPYMVEMIFSLAFNLKRTLAIKLIINKADLLRMLFEKGYVSHNGSSADLARSLYGRLIDHLGAACRANGVEDCFTVSVVSAKDGYNVDEIFAGIFREYSKRRP